MGLLDGFKRANALNRAVEAQRKEIADRELAAADVHVQKYFSVGEFRKDAEHMTHLGFEVASQGQVGRGGYGILVTYKKRV